MIRFFADHPTAANLMMVAFLVLGISALGDLKRETFPDFQRSEVQISVVYPGATAEEVEQAIVQRMEDAIDGIAFVREIVAEAREGIGVVTAEMAPRGDLQVFLDDVRTEIDSIDEFPLQAEEPVIEELFRTEPVVSLAVTGPMDAPSLRALCDEIKARMQRLPEISLVNIRGFGDHQIRIEVDAQAARGLGLSVLDVARAVSRQSLDLPLGTVETRESEVLLRFTDERVTPQAHEDLIILGADRGAEVRLGDIATVSEVFDPPERRVFFDGQRAGVLAIEKTKSEDTLNVFNAVRRFMREESERLPSGVHLALTQDMSSLVADRLSMLVKNGVQGLVLVFGVMALFFAPRFAFWVVMGLPVSFLGAFFVFPLLGISINMISMVGLLLGIGLLMDDAIVLAESIATHRAEGKGPLDAVLEGVKQVRNGVLSSFATTVLIFGSLLRIDGQIGAVLSAMPLVLILVLSVSLIEAFFILPHHLAHAIDKGSLDRQSRFRRRIERVIEHSRGRVQALATLTVQWRHLTLGLVIMIFFVSLAMPMSGALKFQALPDLDGDVIEARLLMPQGTPLWRTERMVERLTAALEEIDAELTPEQPRDQPLVRHTMVQLGTNIDSREQGPHVATVSADLLPAEIRTGTVDQVLGLWRDRVGEVPDILALTYTEPALGPAGRPIEIRLHGDDLESLRVASLQVEEWLGQFVGVEDILSDLRPGKPEIRLSLREGATALGLSAQAISDQLRAAFHGIEAHEVQLPNEPLEIDVRLRATDQDDFADIDTFDVVLPTGAQVPLAAVAHIEHTRSWARIAHVDGRRTVTVQADVNTDRGNVMEIIAAFQSELEPSLREEHHDLAVSFEGEYRETTIARRSLQRSLLFGLIGVFLLLTLQFRSYQEPLIVMVAIPLCLIGVIWGHMLMGLPLTMPSVVGFISLAGVVVNDSILLVQFIKEHRAEGMKVVDAAPLASRERFRAVLLTSLTTIAGLLPLLFEQSLQAQVLIPLAASLVFGLLASTCLILFVLPALYGVLHDLGMTEDITPESRSG